MAGDGENKVDHDPNLEPVAPNVRAIVEAVIKHENEAHEGQRCFIERANAVAYLAHGLMMKPEEWTRAGEVLEWYHEEHRERAHRHKPEEEKGS